MLGFRSHKLWKKILSVTYLVFWGIIFLVSMLDGKFKNITTYDFIITKIQNLILLTILASPYIFLSKTKLRSKMPLFKANKKGKSFLGLIIVNIILFIIFGIVNGSHSKEYLADMANHDYQIIEQTEATCETPGTINYQCNYCGTTKSETIEALGHDMKELSKTEATCEKEGLLDEKCERCGETKETTLQPLGHNMKVISETEAVCENGGSIIKSCEVCGKTEETKSKALGHKMKEISRKQPTENTDGKIVEKCSLCGVEEVETIKRIERTEKTGDTNKNNKKDEADNKPSKMRIETKANSTSNADEKSIYKITVNGVEYVDALYAFYSGVDLYMEGDGEMYKSFKIIEVKENLQQNDMTCALGAKVSEYAYDGSGKIIDTYWKDADHMLNANRKLTGKPAYFVRRDQVKELKKVDIPTEEVKWLNLAGHIYPDVKIYIGSETAKRYLGKVSGINYKYQTFEIIYENGSREWKDRKEMISNNSLYVRADDPNLK